MIELEYDPGIGKRWAVIKVPAMNSLSGDYSGCMYSYADEARLSADDWNAANEYDPVASGYRFTPITAQSRIRYYIVGRKVLNRLGLVTDTNEFGTVSP